MKSRSVILLLALLPLLGLFGACSTLPDPKPERDAFFEQWRELVESSQPVIRPVEPEVAEPAAPEIMPRRPPRTVAERTAELHTALPTTATTINLVDVPIGTAMRSLARVARQNIIINPSVTGSVNIHVDRVPWNDVFMSIIESYGLVAALEGGVIRVMSVEDLRRQVERQGLYLEEEHVSPLLTRVIPVRFSEPASLAESLTPMLSRDKEGNPRGSVTVDRHTRSLVLRDTAENQERLADFLREVDQATPQVLIEAHIIETNQEVARELGVQWGSFWRGRQRVSDDGTDGFTYQAGNPIGEQYSLDVLSGEVGFYTASVAGNILEMQLQALQREGKVNILSRPSIATLDNHEAVLESGTEVPYQTIEDGTTSVQYKDAVLRLLVTPQVISRDNIKLKIEAQKDEVDQSRTVLGNPFIIKKLAQTNLIVEDGATVVIAGLAKERQASSSSGVPLLKDIPGIGEFFRSDARAGEFEELLIFITPRILSADNLENRNYEHLRELPSLR
ncbi:type IV pilus secretin PilQ [Desulfurivibrio dismutans]|uniref:type IV pilus secretin PilQ n=1 Tax=Desulfurivibrio dismutans TaxID=1398908 RepID=UPI0023DC273D|nr:type IV pilus secretin PilQ [Desulfurivibrio alkaliphilus]MDF1615450.1 type IV pilus secretin PilQ [Desulfurivibrio alkaliphilus]